HERADHAEEQDPLLQFSRYPHRDEQQHEHEDVVHAEGSFEQVAGQVLAAGGRAAPQPQDRAEHQRGAEPQGALYRRGAQAAFRPSGEDEIDHDEHGENGEGNAPRPQGYRRHRVARPASGLTPSGPAPAGGASCACDGGSPDGASQRAQYLVSGAAASSPAGTGDPHCSQEPKRPAARRPRASSMSASFLRAPTARRSSAAISGWPAPSPVPSGTAAAATW